MRQQPKVKQPVSATALVATPLFAASDTARPGADTQSWSPSTVNRKIRWRWGVLAALAMALLSFYPQIDLWLTRGADWQGSFTSLCTDEEIYAAYIHGLVLGRPRLTQPLEIPNPAKPSYESHYSIQAVPAYLIASVTRALGLTVVQAFIALTPLMAFLSTLALFYLLISIIPDEAVAAVSALAILIFGTLVARQSVALGWLGLNPWGNFLFLRRYEPAAVFPIFLGFIALAWQAFIRQGRQAWWASIAAGAVFAVLIFSYFFLWTAAVAWLACFALVWLVARHAEWWMLIKRLAPIALFAAAGLAVYAARLSHRNPAIDEAVSLKFTHAPDFYRAPEWIAAVVILLLLWGVKKRHVPWREPVVLLVGSFALMPFMVFNQQIVTGRSLQPVHYEMFSANYLSLLALSLVPIILWRGRDLHFERRVPGWLMALLTCLVIGWGVVEMNGVTSLFKQRNIGRDHVMPVTKRLTQLAAEHGQGPTDRELVFASDVAVVCENISASAPQVPLVSMSLSFASNLSLEEQQERYFQHLYYSGTPPGSLLRTLSMNDFVAVMAAFGPERYNAVLTNDFKPLTSNEIQEKVRQYAEYVANFNQEHARHHQLSYVVAYNQAPIDFSSLDRWYLRDKGEKIGFFTLYQVKLKSSASTEGKHSPEN